MLIRDEADRIRALVDRMEMFGEKPIERSAVNIHRVLEHVRRLAQSGFAAAHPLLGAVRPLAAAGLGQSRPARAGAAEPREERRRSDHRDSGNRARRDRADDRLPAWHAPRRCRARRCGSICRSLVTVRDNGPASPTTSGRICSSRSSARKPSGSGLGLALVAKIVGDHGGLIEVDSRPGRTEFRLHLPVLTRIEPGLRISRRWRQEETS